jgi:hypothetical protein
MDVNEARKICSKMRMGALVQVRYRDETLNPAARPGYYLRLSTTPVEEMFDEYRENYGEGKKYPLPPFLELGAKLERNGVPVLPFYIRLEVIRAIEPAATIPFDLLRQLAELKR